MFYGRNTSLLLAHAMNSAKRRAAYEGEMNFKLKSNWLTAMASSLLVSVGTCHCATFLDNRIKPKP